jgi:hypothetical protein
MQTSVLYKKSKCRYYYVPLTHIYKCYKNVRKNWGKQLRGNGQKNKSGDYGPHLNIVFKKLMVAEPELEGELKRSEKAI